MWRAAERYRAYEDAGQKVYVIHLGDHDPSGLDMTRDINDRIELFLGDAQINRIALNYDQVEQYGPPPNPAKVTDSRAVAYMAKHGKVSWELDALRPEVIQDLIEQQVMQLRDNVLWDESVALEESGRDWLRETIGQ